MFKPGKVACIGLGRMGWHIAVHLAKHLQSNLAETRVAVFDIDPDRCRRWADEFHGHCAESASEAAAGAQLIVTSLPADDEVLSIANEIDSDLRTGAIWIDHSTTSAQTARDVAALVADNHAHFLDAPVSGGVDGARKGSLTVMVGGEPDALDSINTLLATYASQATHMGESGAGQIAKMTNQICVIGLCQALAEGLDFASRAGLDVHKVVQVMLQGSSSSWQMENRADKMLAGEYDFGFSTTLMRKDVGLVLEQATAMNVGLPVTRLVAGFLDELDAMGGANWDWCSLMERQRLLREDDSEPS